MAEQVNQAAANVDNNADDQQGGSWMSQIMRWAMMYYAINFFTSKWLGTGKQQSTAQQIDSEGNAIAIPIHQHPHSNMWKQNSAFNIRIYASEEPDLFSVIYSDNANDALIYS